MESEAVAEVPTKPATQPERVAFVTDLLRGGSDDKPEQGTDSADGDATPSETVRGDDSGSSQVDLQQPDAPGGVEDDTETNAPAPDGDDPPVTLSNLAEHLGLEPKDVYELEIPIGDGVTATLGQLKDEFKDVGPVKEAREQIAERESTLEKQLLATRHELNQMLSIVPEQVRAEMVRAAQDRSRHWETQQEQAVLEAVPGWKDPDIRAKDRAQIVEMLTPFGFSQSEVEYTQDARTLRFMRDAMGWKQQLDNANIAAKKQPGKASPPGAKRQGNPSKRKLSQALARAKASPRIQDKTAAVSALIRNK